MWNVASVGKLLWQLKVKKDLLRVRWVHWCIRKRTRTSRSIDIHKILVGTREIKVECLQERNGGVICTRHVCPINKWEILIRSNLRLIVKGYRVR